jgi:hypothetical protein
VWKRESEENESKAIDTEVAMNFITQNNIEKDTVIFSDQENKQSG